MVAFYILLRKITMNSELEVDANPARPRLSIGLNPE